jgi:hypothetical protein
VPASIYSQAMRITAALLVAAACSRSVPPPAAPEAAPPASEAEIRAALTRSAEAYKREDWAGFLEGSRQAQELSPENPDLRYRVARALVRAGRAAEGVSVLERLAAMGLAYRLAANPDLEPVREDPAYKRVAERMTANQTPVSAGEDHLTLPAVDLLVESIARDPKTGALYLSSIHERKIRRVEPSDADFLAPSDEIWGVLDLQIDAARRKLWAGTAVMPQMRGYTEALAGRSAVLCINLDRGVVEQRLELPGEHVFGDLGIDPRGRVWVSDSRGGGVYRVEGDRLTAVIAPGRLRSPQGITFSPDGARAYVADYALGLFVIDTARGTLHPLAHGDDVPVYGIDGLLFHRSGLVAIQNGVQPHRVSLLGLDAAGTRVTSAQVLDMNDHVLEPTHGTFAGDRLYYVATSQWHNFEDGGGLRKPEELTPVVIRRIAVQ